MSDNKNFFGFLNINKPIGLTSHDVVSRLRRITKMKQIGHTGTLDPFAVGVLPIAIGKATKLIEYLDDDKEYLATVQFGKNTTTYDLEGEVVQVFDKKVSEDEILQILKTFEGEILQYPPIYSAIKVKGKKLYEYARAGVEVNIEPRKVVISKIELESFDYDLQVAKITVACSKGTYIRSLAYDIGVKLSCGGYLTNLVRTKAGKFMLENSIDLSSFEEGNLVENKIINPLDVLNLPIYNLNEKEKERVIHGGYIRNRLNENYEVVILAYGGKIYAVGNVENSRILVKKVFEIV